MTIQLIQGPKCVTFVNEELPIPRIGDVVLYKGIADGLGSWDVKTFECKARVKDVEFITLPKVLFASFLVRWM